MSEKILLIDGHSILNRAFYGLPDLTNAEGRHTGAVYGFLNIIFRIMAEEKPNQVEQWKIPKNRLKKFFPSGTSQQKMEETIIKALELYRKREKSRER